MKIEDSSPIKTASTSKKKKSTSSSSDIFGAILEDQLNATSDVEATPELTTMNPLLAMQEVGEFNHSNKERAKKNADETIEHMKEIQLKVLTDEVSVTDIRNLESKIRDKYGNFDDPKLKSIVDAVGLRAAVEIAKREK